jgi:hypothetical protein
MSSQSIWRYTIGNAPTNHIHLVNPTWWYEFTGQTEQDHTANNGMGWLNAVHEEDRLIAERTCSHILVSTDPITAEYRVRVKMETGGGCKFKAFRFKISKLSLLNGLAQSPTSPSVKLPNSNWWKVSLSWQPSWKTSMLIFI